MFIPQCVAFIQYLKHGKVKVIWYISSGTVNGYTGKLSVNVQWSAPSETYGEIKGYRLRYGPRGKEARTLKCNNYIIEKYILTFTITLIVSVETWNW